MRRRFAIRVPLIVICLNLGPVVFPSPIWERRRRDQQLAALYRLYPSGMTEPEAPRALDKTVSLVVIRLNGVPIVKLSWHSTMLEPRSANRMALKQCFQQVAAP